MRWRVVWLILLVLSIIVPADAGWAQKPSGIEWQVTPLYGEKYHPATWLPLLINISNDGTDRVLEVHVGNYRTTLDVPGGSEKATVIYAQFSQSTQIPMGLYEKGNKIDTATLRLDPVLLPIVGTLTEQVMPRIGGFAFSALKASDLSSNALGLQTLDGLLVNEQQWNELSTEQKTAIEQWVSQGGTLITITTATNALPETLRPATTGEGISVNGGDLAKSLGYEQSAEDIAAVTLTPTPESLVLLTAGNQPLLVQRPYASGKVIAVGFDLTDQRFLAWRGVNVLWENLVQRLPVSPWSGAGETLDSIRDSQSVSYLNNLSSLDLPPLKTLLILLAIYVILAGPVNYLILRWRDRMAWAWITIPLLTLIFAAIAYTVGAKQRGTDIIVNELALIQGNGTPTTTLKGYAGLFSPVRQDYRLTAEGKTLLRPLNSSAFQPTGNSQNTIYSQEPNEIPKLTVNQWSMETFAFERTIDNAPTLKYDLTYDGKVLRGTVKNTSNQTFSDAVVILMGNFQKIGELKPNAEQSIEIEVGASFNQNSLSYILYQRELDQAYQSPNGPSRDLLARTQAVDMVMPMSGVQPNLKPVFLAFVDQQYPTMSVDDNRFTRSQHTLYFEYPPLKFSDASMSINSNWLTIFLARNTVNPMMDFCNTSRGFGVALTNRTDEIVIRIPNELASFEPASFIMNPFFEGSFDSSKLSYEFYNWDTATWEAVTLDRGSLTVNTPNTYFRNGIARLRYKLPDNLDVSGGFWGCFSPGITLEGAMR